jgi:hypothetical protein
MKHDQPPAARTQTRKIFDVRIYPSDEGGFDIWVRRRGYSFQRLSTWPTLQSAFDEAGKIEGRKPNAPVYVYRRSFSKTLAELLTPVIVEALGSKGGTK